MFPVILGHLSIDFLKGWKPQAVSHGSCAYIATLYQLCAQDVENGIRMSCFRFTRRRSCPKVEQMRLSVEQNTCCCRTSNRRVTVVTLPQPQTPRSQLQQPPPTPLASPFPPLTGIEQAGQEFTSLLSLSRLVVAWVRPARY